MSAGCPRQEGELHDLAVDMHDLSCSAIFAITIFSF